MLKPTKVTIRRNSKRTEEQGENEVKQIGESNLVKTVASPRSATPDISIGNQDQLQTLSKKNPLPPIASSKSQLSDGNKKDDNNRPEIDVAEENYLPLKLFDGKKQSLDELNPESMTYIWMRRMKEIFLHMNDGRNNNDEIDPFVEFDMKLAKADITKTCDRYIENERVTLMKQSKNPVTTKKSTELGNDEKSKPIDLAKKQEWDMKKLYVEVFKMSYKLNRLKTQAEQDELIPSKTGDDQPNFGNAIWWYSCDRASIYYQINSIVRLENFELLMSYRYYLSDLCRMIEFMYQKKKKEDGDVAHTFYRADNISPEQLEMMGKKQKSQFITLLGFVSTTSDIGIAKGYAQKQRVYANNERVLFVISVKPHVPCTAFAYIDRISFHPEEKEVLFSMGSSFMVEYILKPAEGENYHIIHLTACEIDKSLADNIRIKVANCSPSGRAVLLARYLVELGEHRAARKYLVSLLSEARDNGVLANDISLAGVYSCLGLTYARQGLHSDALKAFQQTLNTQARLEYSNNNALSEIHNNIGLAYVGLGYMDEAEATFDKAARMQLREPKSNQQFLASIYSNIGYVHHKQKRYDEAEKAYKNAEKFFKQNTNRITHDALELSLMKAEFLTNYGRLLSVHKSTTNNRHPEDFYSEALKLYKSILSDGDPKLMQTYINIMLAFAQNKSYREVTKCFNDPTVKKLIEKQEANIFELNSSITQTSLSSLYELAGACYASDGDFNAAIEVWKDAYVFERKARLERALLVTTDGNSSILTTEHNRFIHEWYHKATHHYGSLSSNTNDEKREEKNQFSTNMCLGFLYAKLHNRNSAVECLTKALEANLESDEKILFISSLLLADIFKRRQHYDIAITNFNRALESIQLGSDEEDPVLYVEVKLARIDCHKDKQAIDTLRELYRSLKSYGSDTKYICLKTIVLDTLARYCLMLREYENFNYSIEQSIALKQNSLSQYHPSLAIDFIFQAEFHVQKAEALHGETADIGDIRRSYYREALTSYERALEVYTLNLSNNNLEMKKIYYAMGDIMCDMDELSNAMEKYNVAETNNYLDEDENNAQILVEEDAEEPVEIWMARASMHRHLAEYQARKKDYKEAIVEMTQSMSLYSKQLPPSFFDTDNKQTVSHDVLVVTDSLRHLAQCYAHLGDILGIAQNEDGGYFIAANIYTKLVSNDKSVKKDEAVLYEKISVYYANLGDHFEALASLRKAVDLGNTSIATLYAVGRLNNLCHKFNEAEQIFQALLAHPSIHEHKHLKQIIQGKLNAVQILKSNQKLHSKSSHSSDDDKHHSSIIDVTNQSLENTHSNSSQRDGNDRSTSVADTGNDPSDYRSTAAAYLVLQDIEMAMIFYQKDIKQRSKMISEPAIFKLELEKIDQTSYSISHQDILPALPKLFHSLVDEFQKIVKQKDSDMLLLADSFFQCAIIHSRLSSHIKAIKAYITSFGLYASELDTTNNESKTTLIDIMRNLLNAFVQCKLKPKQIVDIYIQLSLPNEANQMRLKLITMHRGNELDNIDDVHGISTANHESHISALQYYNELLKNTNDMNLKGVCYYSILRFYKHHLHPDKFGKDIVDSLKSCLSMFNVLDRHLLSQLAIDFLHEYGKYSGDHVVSDSWQISAKGSLNTKQVDSKESYIGLSLLDTGNLSAAEAYRRSIIKQIEDTLSNRVVELVHDSDTTLKEILRAMEQFEHDNILLCSHLTTVYEKLADYYMETAFNGRNIDKYLLAKAENMYTKAIHLLEECTNDISRIQNIKAKQQRSQEVA
ncbi:unnamed protein product [Rotaria magnacalcarata]|uniref:Uncharacterized protein n=4 Tax=Rotaria magnacalcarata TaxID=392030 RepID=A0A816N774_9BILA|nr:unnamed protein product [Rotaria magnacalcarata]